MTEALHNLPRDTPGAPAGRASLACFASVLLGEPPYEPTLDAVTHAAWSEHLAADRLRRGREMPPEKLMRALPYRSLYALARDRAAKVAVKNHPNEERTKPAKALAALLALRHRQRAALALRYLVGLKEAEVAYALGIPAKTVAGVISGGVAAIDRAIKGPIDVARSLRSVGSTIRGAAARATPPPKPDVKAPPAEATLVVDAPAIAVEVSKEVVAEARAVVRTLLAPPPRAERLLWALRPTTIPRPVYGVRKLRGRAPAAPAATVAPASSGRALRWSSLATAAACMALVVFALLPHATIGVRPAAPPLAVVAVGPAGNAAPAQHAPAPPARFVSVRPGDTLWDIAGGLLGDPRRWREIWAENAGETMPDGDRFRSPQLIRPGWRLKLPEQ